MRRREISRLVFPFALPLCLAVGGATVPTFILAKEAPPQLMSGLSDLHHPVSTKNHQAQAFFDQGLKLVYAFNHDEARLSFARAAELDPTLAMAWWGVALTLGPNYNLPVDPEREKGAYDAVQKAISLEANASEPERAYISALGVRYSNDPKADLHQLDAAYKDAMAKLAARYPDDLDAATLYAESMMNLHPWKLWSADGKPNEDTNEIVTVLESVLKRDPNHLGANHYYIHAVEASLQPERALASAARLEKLAPAAGHLVHMPAHIYARVGQHAASAHCNELAVNADKKWLASTHQQGVYPAMYYSHNLHFLAYANCMRENFAEAKRAADELAAHIKPHVKEMPMLEGFLPTPFFVLVAFDRWNDVLRLPPPDASLVYTTAQWHFARAMALAGLRRIESAQQEATAFASELAKLPPDAAFDPLNSVADIARVQQSLLLGMIARNSGQEHEDAGEAIKILQKTVAAEDLLNYSEPPSWYPPVRPLLGRVLLEEKHFADAEKVFRADLEHNVRHTRSLAGLRDALKAQGHDYEAEQIDQQLRATGKLADVTSATSARAR